VACWGSTSTSGKSSEAELEEEEEDELDDETVEEEELEELEELEVEEEANDEDEFDDAGRAVQPPILVANSSLLPVDTSPVILRASLARTAVGNVATFLQVSGERTYSRGFSRCST
jgi:hypothetical protein